MTSTARRRTFSFRVGEGGTWPFMNAPLRVRAVFTAVDIATASALVWLGVTNPPGLHHLVLVVFLASIALLFEEAVTRSARLQLRLSADLKRDMTSVWAIGGAVALRPSSVALLLLIVLTYTWLRHQRPAGEDLYRKVFNSSNNLASAMVASAVAARVSESFTHAPWGMTGALAALAAIAAYGLSNRLIFSVALLALGVQLRNMLGTRDENLIEFATLCLGGLVAVAVAHQPLLAVLVLAPMVTLQRGAVTHELEMAATTDPKTGLLNAVAWEAVATRELLRAAREGNELAVLIIDVDHFKLVNDRYGHLVGDRVLRLLARTLTAGVREYDTVARFGGEEFVAVLPSATDSEALVTAERLRSRINELRMSAVVEGLDPALDERIAVSVGVSTAPIDGVELADLLRAADAALYQAKAEGRNRVILADRGQGNGLQSLSYG